MDLSNIFNLNDTSDKIEKQIMYISRQEDIGKLSPWMNGLMKNSFSYLTRNFGNEGFVIDAIVKKLCVYIDENEIKDFVIGMSGGADSATTYALLKEVQKQNGYEDIRIHAYTLPIYQNTEETLRANDLVNFYGDTIHHVDLTLIYKAMADGLFFENNNEEGSSIRKGNMKARLRMMYLYNVAHKNKGVVVSTDNFSEYTAGFWTINGDVGDIAPIRNLFKSVEVPAIAKELGVPEKFWRATPTDGLGISSSDEEQLGMSYLEWDILTSVFMKISKIENNIPIEEYETYGRNYFMIFNKMIEDVNGVSLNSEDLEKVGKFLSRVYNSWYKRFGVINISSTEISKIEEFSDCEDTFVIPWGVL